MDDVREALADDHPFALLALVSTLLSVVDPRTDNPFERTRGERTRPSRDDLLLTFAEVDRAETTALLAAAAVLTPDHLQRRRVERTLASRAHRLPAWLTQLGKATAYRTVEMTHVLRDGDNVIVGVRLATGEELTAIVYIDHNLGTLVKDAFIVAEPIADLLDVMRDRNTDPDSGFAPLSPADARTRIVEAIGLGAMTYPPFETDTWPACRPLVEWMVSLLPDGGRGYERPEWSDTDRERLAQGFFASELGAPLDDADHRDLLDSILWFGCDYGPGDPMRWSPVAVEILLDDWIPRKIVAPPGHLSKAPALVRAFIRYCHKERAVPTRLTQETLDAVDRWEPGYQRAIRSPRPQGPAALLAAVGALDPDGPWELPGDEDDALWDYGSMMLDMLHRAVGGPDALDGLDDDPLPDEPFDWSGTPSDIRERVDEVLRLVNGCCDALLDVEHSTASRRVLARIAANGPDVFRRRGRSDTAAAAICWAVCRVNDTFDQRHGGLTQKRLLAHFGISSGNVSSRAATLLAAGGFPRSHGDLSLGSPDYLVSSRRRAILDKKDRLPEELD